jgi:hypothetical protein
MQSISPGSPQPSICLIMPFFDEKKNLAFLRKKQFPAYFDFFLESFSKNKNITLKIFTNIPTKKYQSYTKDSSIQFFNISLHEAYKRFVDRLGIVDLSYKDFRAYKICDFKPTFGLVFSEYLQGFDYWGYFDADMIIGNLSPYFRSETLNEFNIITATKPIAGCLTLYKNQAAMNTLFQKSPDHVKVFNSAKNYKFDEGGDYGIIAMTQILERENIRVGHINGLVHNDCGSNNVDRAWKYLWKNGELTDCLTQETIGALHLVKSKRKAEFVIEALQKNSPFLIDQTGIHPVS